MKHLLQTYGGHYRALFFLGLPIVIGQLGVIVLGFADTLMIGHHSTPELAAASFVNNMFNLCIIFSTGFSYGLTPVVGGLYGNNRLAEAGQALRCSLAANVLVAFLQMAIMTVLYLNVEKLGQPEELIPLIKPYYLVLLASLPFVMLFNGFKQFTDGITDTQTAMWILLGGNALNIAGNYVLINGKLGFPEWGLLGAGVSTLVSRIVMVVVFALIVLRGRRFRRYRAGFFRRGEIPLRSPAFAVQAGRFDGKTGHLLREAARREGGRAGRRLPYRAHAALYAHRGLPELAGLLRDPLPRDGEPYPAHDGGDSGALPARAVCGGAAVQTAAQVS